MSTNAENDDRQEARKQFRLAGLWGTMNSLKRESDNQRAASAKQHGIQATDLPGYGNEIPFGNTFVSQTSTGSPLGKLAQVAVLALAAGAAGFGLHSFYTPEEKPVTPPPVDAVLEWEIIPDGESGSRSSSVSESTHGVRSETSEGIGVGISGVSVE